MLNAAWLFVMLLWSPLAILLFLKFLPSLAGKFLAKEIERRSDIRLERIKADLEGSYSTLKTSVDVLVAGNSGMRSHIISAVSALWQAMIKMRDEYGSLVAFDSIILAEEADKAFADQQNPKHAKICALVGAHADERPLRRDSPMNDSELEHHRLFCGDRLWLIFYTYRATLGRSSLLISWSFQQGSFRDWRRDDPIAQLFGMVLSVETLREARETKLNGLNSLFGRLEAEFLHEAARVMSGSKVMADSLSDMQSIMLLQNAKIGERR